ncbi:hypothetical protein MCOR29_000398 [Pyricularia oryzae]|uniref:Uncharacterized protein n=1 Tax=Pyricularia oryzae TaxID=318829 RepID=A0A4P7NFV0_PYROR|nr:hypothetical protein MCOR01_004785 [Pyricularia oryzae]KAI6283712.1 hypothetical protein MCOR26_002307 [Pyricularia oryzae]KAI6335242.1 hypothetical protein MCOR29_000398 [Pyricularia oryzae]KAI6343342.1 hypothetical protein MCOR30_001511 [Pyricularia oryzae]KAI6343458.1 hypothetical protein MCOR28_004793 [Pyricularia oryzae]
MKSSLAAPMLAHARLRVAEWVSGPANVVWVLLAQASSQCHKPLDLSSGELERGMWVLLLAAFAYADDMGIPASCLEELPTRTQLLARGRGWESLVTCVGAVRRATPNGRKKDYIWQQRSDSSGLGPNSGAVSSPETH